MNNTTVVAMLRRLGKFPLPPKGRHRKRTGNVAVRRPFGAADREARVALVKLK